MYEILKYLMINRLLASIEITEIMSLFFYTYLHLSLVIISSSITPPASWKVKPLAVNASLCESKKESKKERLRSVIEPLGTLLDDGSDQGHGELHCDKCDLLSEWQRASGALFQVAISSTLKQGLKPL